MMHFSKRFRSVLSAVVAAAVMACAFTSGGRLVQASGTGTIYYGFEEGTPYDPNSGFSLDTAVYTEGASSLSYTRSADTYLTNADVSSTGRVATRRGQFQLGGGQGKGTFGLRPLL